MFFFMSESKTKLGKMAYLINSSILLREKFCNCELKHKKFLIRLHIRTSGAKPF